MTDDIAAWFDGLSDAQRAIANDLRHLVIARAPDLTEEIKWRQPCYTGTALVCYIQKAKGHVALGFGRGAELAWMHPGLDGDGSQMRHVRIPLGTTPDHDRLGRLIDAALALDTGG